ncbi:MAG: Phosphatidylglycerol--prolipoprotein diacylglyceryl transferase [Chlamydiia bacterium]|nr:Phosphatidylglycerol--prolipoprotein diacylglyceryl transferase [Chlamydiia bacterium]MCH9618094.1 Phosphatidylglycerol--prolipoprotein diacylglyceryl transferase [Chlamydiia bacterium]MCH9623974.1 Phosphatidylglycerol--prolipoprotein diacylglyceryl transferase [Chlamydiia bacterium]
MFAMLFSFITFDMDPVCFSIPFIEHDIAWYGVIFSASFYVGYKIFIWIYARYSLQNITIPEKYEKARIPSDFVLSKKGQKLLDFYQARVSNKEKVDQLKLRLYLEEREEDPIPSIQSQSITFAESALLYIIIATVVGSRLGHILFYENIWPYITSPIMIIKTWEGGLASHGGIIAIFIAAYLFIRKRSISFLTFMDLISIPTIFVCSWIRIGNFVNQEILGAASSLPWAIIFKHPADGALPVARHPMQLYEFLLYASVFFLLFSLWKKNTYKKQTGLYTGLTLVISFSVRFFLEFLKVPQSIYDYHFPLQTGQLLSIPMILFGLVLIIKALGKKEALDKKVHEH